MCADVTVSWEMAEYSVNEMDENVTACVVLSGVTEELSIDIWVNISTSDGSAVGECRAN